MFKTWLTGYILGVIIGVFVGLSLLVETPLQTQEECEHELPRNEVCIQTWLSPSWYSKEKEQ